MNENEQELLNALRGLAADGPRQAPPHVEEFLVAELRRRSRGRRSKVWWSISAFAAIAAGKTPFVLEWAAPPRNPPFFFNGQVFGISPPPFAPGPPPPLKHPPPFKTP